MFYQSGFHAISYVLTVFIAEIADKKYRPLVLSLTCLHPIAASFAGPAFVQEFQRHSSFRWAYAVLLIATFVLSLPVLISIRCHKQSEEQAPNRGHSPTSKSIKEYYMQLDSRGLLPCVSLPSNMLTLSQSLE